jgi:tetratricopeptide (TPR) repeat protein
MKSIARARNAALLLWLAFSAGCGALEVGRDVQAGRMALQGRRPEEALTYFSRAAESDPNYKLPNRGHESVLTYLGRAYYETGDDAKARAVLQRALHNDQNDPLAHLYLGLSLYRSNDRDQGRKEIEAGLNGIHGWLDEISSDGIYGPYWDTGKSIRTAIERTLAGKPEAGELTASAQRIGRQFDNEFDRASQAEVQSIYQKGGKD